MEKGLSSQIIVDESGNGPNLWTAQPHLRRMNIIFFIVMRTIMMMVIVMMNSMIMTIIWPSVKNLTFEIAIAHQGTWVHSDMCCLCFWYRCAVPLLQCNFFTAIVAMQWYIWKGPPSLYRCYRVFWRPWFHCLFDCCVCWFLAWLLCIAWVSWVLNSIPVALILVIWSNNCGSVAWAE